MNASGQTASRSDLAGLWLDELYSGWIVDPAVGVPETMKRAVRDVGPPLHYVLLWPVVQVAGTGEVGLRLPSVLCTIAAIAGYGLSMRR